MIKNRRKALTHFQSLLTHELGEGYEWNGISISKLTELLSRGMASHPLDMSSHMVKDLVLTLRDCEENDWCLALDLYGRSWKGHLHVTLVAEEDVWAMVIIEDRHGRRTITWSVSMDNLLSLGEEKE